jgi:beta-N-acetylhexosaminidase
LPRLILSALAAALLTFAAANVMDPYMVPVRSWSAGGLIAASALGLVVAARSRWRWRWAILALWCAVPVTLAAAEAVFYWRKAIVLAETGPEVRALGRHFIVGYTSAGDVEILAARGFIGGVFVTQHNARGKTPAQLHSEIERLQNARRANNLPPLIVATDQEGGYVSRLSPPLERHPMLSTLASLPAGELKDAAHALGLAQGRDLAAAGITVNFAPVLDLRPAQPPSLLDRNSQIGRRAISGDAKVVAGAGLGYVQGLHEAGITATLKHFPGLGRAAGDTHHFRASVSATREELEASDWLPFREVLAGSQALLMIGHVTLTAIDPAHPASHSRALIDGILRKQWGYQGVIVTDDVLMSPIYQYGLCEALTEGFNAGVDIALVAYDMQQFYRVMRCVLTASRSGLLDAARLEESARRLSVIAPPPGR